MRTRSNGATLLEVVVVGTVFSVLLAILMAIFQTTIRVQRHIELKSDLDRVLLSAARHLESSLRTSRVVAPTWTESEPVRRLELIPLKLSSDGTPVVTAEGWPEWGIPFVIEFQPEREELVRLQPERRVLARVGADGEVTFQRLDKSLLKMRLKVEVVGAQEKRALRDSTLQFRLFNQ